MLSCIVYYFPIILVCVVLEQYWFNQRTNSISYWLLFLHHHTHSRSLAEHHYHHSPPKRLSRLPVLCLMQPHSPRQRFSRQWRVFGGLWDCMRKGTGNLQVARRGLATFRLPVPFLMQSYSPPITLQVASPLPHSPRKKTLQVVSPLPHAASQPTKKTRKVVSPLPHATSQPTKKLSRLLVSCLMQPQSVLCPTHAGLLLDILNFVLHSPSFIIPFTRSKWGKNRCELDVWPISV